jgi:hypothetical protein
MPEIAGHVAESTSLRGQSLNKENDKAHNSGPPNYLPKTTQNGILTKNYSLSFRFFHLASFLFMLPPSWRSALSVAKDGACGGGTDTSCLSGPGITPMWSTISATFGASSACGPLAVRQKSRSKNCKRRRIPGNHVECQGRARWCYLCHVTTIQSFLDP